MFAHEDDTLLMERAQDLASLLDMAPTGWNDEASRIICGTVTRLHAARAHSPPELIPLAQWFKALASAAMKYDGCRKYNAV